MAVWAVVWLMLSRKSRSSLAFLLLLLMLMRPLVLQVPLASIPQFYFPGGGAAESMDDDVKQQFVSSVNALFEPHPAGLNLEQFSAVVQEVRCRFCLVVLVLAVFL